MRLVDRIVEPAAYYCKGLASDEFLSHVDVRNFEALGDKIGTSSKASERQKSLSLSLYIMLVLPICSNQDGNRMENSPLPVLDVVKAGVISNVTSVAGSLSPRMFELELIFTFA